MQALLSFRLPSLLPAHAAVLVEAHTSRSPLAGNVAVAGLPVGAGDGVRSAQSALDVGSRHARAYLLLYNGFASGLLGQQVATAVVLFAYHRQ